MKILTVLTYYRPHTSGLTIYVERLARTLVKRGHQVTVLTSQYEPQLAPEEFIDGVRIVRAPVLLRPLAEVEPRRATDPAPAQIDTDRKVVFAMSGRTA